MLSLFLQVCPLHLYCIGLLSPLYYFLLVYYHIFKLKKGKSKKKTIHLPTKEEGVFLEILDKNSTFHLNLRFYAAALSFFLFSFLNKSQKQQKFS